MTDQFDKKFDGVCNIGEKKLDIKTKVDCGVGCGFCFIHLIGVIDVEKCIFLDWKKFFLEKKYPFSVLIVAPSKKDDCPKPHDYKECDCKCDDADF